MILTTELPAHAGAIERLLDTAFGPKRKAKTVYRLRRGVAPVADLCMVALDEEAPGYSAAQPRLVASIRYWPVMAADGTMTLMLGPIAVAEDYRSAGLGGQLIRASLARAEALGYASVLLVGDAPYYNRFGFTRQPVLGLKLPGPVELDRFLGLEFIPGSLSNAHGMLGRAPVTRTAVPAATTVEAAAAAETGVAKLARPRRRAVR
ncbi:GNAT family N-acetyltransferase [Nitrospirillum viridazoti]|uniref:GNAT family N-acetyltransferase n=1 Tax=Nitrospirillum viridazoti CBAmc TaxID=1441467 RepID=A0A248JSS7_9PROT|nr:N-acetyltransferase [Nitrospirillum amazonense]ASG21570.1 GNAT family N-acetyltransferase [Nitrospirillum amazonense CBAmc]TWB42290.1 putative N-acetyltransferase YhbS [Nitrospirillum amazonense]